MLDITSDAPHGPALGFADASASRSGGRVGARAAHRSSYQITKRALDLAGAVVLLPVLLLTVLVLALLNPFLNRGRLFFVQERMGQNCQPFWAWKFRSMAAASEIARGPFDALDSHRITRLGTVLRKTRLDELPQVINVLKGEMSLIGPRPDYYPHACTYAEEVSGYRERHAVRPGISGYAQVEVGYVAGLEGVRNKVAADLYYLRHAGLRLDLWIGWRTLAVVLGRKGA